MNVFDTQTESPALRQGNYYTNDYRMQPVFLREFNSTFKPVGTIGHKLIYA